MPDASADTPHFTGFSDPGVERYRQSVREWLAQSLPADWRQAGHQFATFEEQLKIRRAWDQLKYRGGYAAIAWPKEYGGRGEGPIEEFIFFEEAAKAHAPDTAGVIGYDLAGPAIIEYGTPDQKKRFLPGIVTASDLWCEGFSEPDAGSDLANASTRAEKVANGYRIHGHKIWTSRAQYSDWCYLLAKTADGPPRRNLTVFLFNMRQPGVRVAPIRQISERPEFNEVFFDGAFVPDADRLGQENDGWRLAGLSGFRQSRRVFDALRWFVLIQETLDQLESDITRDGPRYRQRYLELSGRTQALRWHMRRVTEMMASGGNWLPPSQILRLAWSELWQEITECGVAVGLPETEAYWRMRYLEARAVTIHSGTAQIQRNLIADRVLELPR